MLSLHNSGKRQVREQRSGQELNFVPGPQVPALPFATAEPTIGSPPGHPSLAAVLSLKKPLRALLALKLL